MKAWQAAFVAIAFVLTLVHPTVAETPPTPSRSLPDLMALFPSAAHLPAPMVLVEEETRSAAEVAATFPDPDDAAHVLQVWGWAFNADRVYVAGVGGGADTPSRLEISLQQFSTDIGAAYALSYFAHGRAVMRNHGEGIVPGLRPCEAQVSGGSEVTRYVRFGDVLIRVTVTMPGTASEPTYNQALRIATTMVTAVLENTGASADSLDHVCR
jgi:hypothetical protein